MGALVDLLPVALVVTAADGQILRANAAACALLATGETLTGQPIQAVLAGRDLFVRMRTLSHAGEVVRLYVVQERWFSSAYRPPRTGAQSQHRAP